MGLSNHVERSWVCRGEGDEKTKKTMLVLTSIVFFWLKAGRDFSHLKNEEKKNSTNHFVESNMMIEKVLLSIQKKVAYLGIEPT